jgi:NTP pyrophosphatase (non-canonical NTP hydrolase)
VVDQTRGDQPVADIFGLPVFHSQLLKREQFVLINPDGKPLLMDLIEAINEAKAQSELSLNEYQRQSMRTAVDPGNEWSRDFQTSGFGLGLTGEAAEVLELAMKLAMSTGQTADLLKKQIHHEHGKDREAMKKELGDDLWYIQAIAARYGLTLEEVAQANIDKLKSRYPNGWTAEDSINRAQEDK